MFNIINRNKKESFSIVKPLLFIVCQAYFMTPAVVYFIYKKSNDIKKNFALLRQELFDKGFVLFGFVMVVPILLFAALSIKKMIGLHWLIGFYPFMYILVYFMLSVDELIRTVKLTAVFTIIHLFLIGAVLSVPVKYFHSNKNYSTIIIGTPPGEVKKYLAKYEGSYVLATPSYADSALLTYHMGEYFSVFGGGSHHGRQDDILTDFRTCSGKDILIIRSSEPKVNEYSIFFTNIEIERIVINGAQFFLVAGYNFNFENYRNVVLKDINPDYS